MSKVPSNVNLKTKRETPRTLKPDPTAKRITHTKSTASTKTTEESDKPKTKPTSINSSSTTKSKTQTLSKPTLRTTGKVSQNIKKSAVTKPPNVPLQRSTTSTHKQPIRAKHTTEIKDAIKRTTTAKTTTSKITQKIVNAKPNAVLDTPHNVTVSSPPPVRKYEKEEILETNKSEVKLNRKGSRTLAPEEIVVLKRESAKKRIEEQIRRESIQQTQPAPSNLKEPVAFEVNFEEQEKKPRERSRSRPKQIITQQSDKDDELNYSDDFESYESDFETGSSTKSQDTSAQTSTESEDVSEETSEESDADDIEKDLSNKPDYDDTEDESELTQNPITVIPRDKERKLDSGHYEMNSRNNHAPKLADISAQSTQHLMDSLETFSLATSEQLDSGISAYGGSTIKSCSTENLQVFYGGYKDFNTKPIINKRGCDLMSKIQFDTLSFTLFDLKPISYDIYMQTFGKLNTYQGSTQTQDNNMDVEQQTEVYETRSMWTQHPAQYDLEMVQTLGTETAYKGMFLQNCCGEAPNQSETKIDPECELEESLHCLKLLNTQSSKRGFQNQIKKQRKPTNYEYLNSFLLKYSLAFTQILGSSANGSNKAVEHSPEKEILSRVSEKFYYIDSNFLNTLKVSKIFCNSKNNLLITVHESLPETNVYSSDFSNLLMVWCMGNCDKPLRMLTTWSQVSRVEISSDSSDVIVAALRDGSVALWDLRETYSFCSKLDGYLTHFAATQSIVPTWLQVKGKSEILRDLGSCLDVRSFRCQTNNLGVQKTFNKPQFVSLHDSGVITVWTLVETSETTFNLMPPKKSERLSRFEYSSPWARVKLIQTSIANMKDYLDTKFLQNQSRFDKTKALFQRNIYSDEALKELNENNMDTGQQGLRFTSIECGTETIYICTNRNFIMTCSKTLKMERFRRIIINESRYLFPTAIKVLSNENFLAVGLSNGAVMIVNCDTNKPRKKADGLAQKPKTPDTPQHRHTLLDFDPISGKSCAIQNIVLNAQKSFDNMDFTQEYRPDTAACIGLIDSKQKPFELRVYDQQILLTGSVLRKNLIQSIVLSSDGWRLFVLSNGHVRIYDFYLEQEIAYHEENQQTGNVTDIATGKSGNNEINLIMLKENSHVEVHILKK